MGYRIMQVVLYVMGALFALGACQAVTEPWSRLDSDHAAGRAAGYMIAALLAIICVVVAQQFGQRARQAKDPD
ncbi:MAG TPA: hypothetical protein VK813_18095 [Edaphobacter sp.]|jgi:hypothetical protein|nr:hypothetical protein [Edaphobacter sp.]